MSPHQKAMQVALAYAECKSAPVVARQIGLSSSQVYRMLDLAGVERPNPKNRFYPEGKVKLRGEQAAAAAQDYADGVPIAILKAKYGVGAYAIRTAAKAAGYSKRPRGQQPRRFTQEDRKLAVQLYRSGLSQSKVAEQMKASLNQVRRILMKEGVEPRIRPAKGARHGNWKGGRSTTKHGYVMALLRRDDPMWCMANSQGYVFEHRLVIARAIGRPLLESETVHHVDGDRANNELNNLQLRFGNHGKGVAMVCAKCGCREIHYETLD